MSPMAWCIRTAVQVVLPLTAPSGPGLSADLTGTPDDAVQPNMSRRWISSSG
jgi:hypothetical protein